MKHFFKSVLIVLFALFLYTFLLIGIGFIILVIAESTNEPEIKSNSILKLSLNDEIKERELPDLFENIPGLETDQTGLLELKSTIQYAMKDPKIKGIYLDVSDVKAGFSTIEELRNKLIAFKKSGKFIYTYSNYYSEKSYYLASVADSIWLNPLGFLELNGLSFQLLFFKGTFDKLGIKPEIFQVGNYKSALEPFMRENMSDANREQVTSFLNGIYTNLLVNICFARNLSYKQCKLVSDSMLIKNAKDAKKLGFIDKLAYEDEFHILLCKKMNVELEKDLEFVGYNLYKKIAKEHGTKFSKNKVAVIYSVGAIQGGEDEDNNIIADKLCPLIRKVRDDKSVKSIVLRVNSPGGEALASDRIWREIQLAREVKPIIASMSDVAASGGYYISMGCDKIVAEKNTITGSIGVIGLVFTAENFLKDLLGITSDRVNTGAYSDLASPTRSMTEAERKYIQFSLDDIYDVFTRKAAQGRNMSQTAIHEIAEGRVWTGEQALSNGLVDTIGGLELAINIAAKQAGIAKDYQVKNYPVLKDPLTKLLTRSKDGIKLMWLKWNFGHQYEYFNALQSLEKFKGIQARLPYEINIK